MDLLKYKKDGTILHLLCNDHIPNPAMKNEFVTSTFKLKLYKLEWYETSLNGYSVEQGGVFLSVTIGIKNLTREIIAFTREDLLISNDHYDPYPPEEYFEVEGQLEDEIALRPNEEIKGKYIYIINENAKKITLRYIEEYEDDKYKEYRLRYVIPK